MRQKYHSNAYRSHWYGITKVGTTWESLPYRVVIKGPRFEYLELKAASIEDGIARVREVLRAGLAGKKD